MEDDSIDAGPGRSARAGAAGPGSAPNVQSSDPPVDPVADHDALDEEFRLFYRGEMPRLVGFLIVRGVEAGLAADIAQETMLEAYRRWNDLDTPRGWIRTVALRRAARFTGRWQIEKPTEQLPEPSGLLTPTEADVIVQRHALIARLAALPEAQREVVAFTFDGYQPNEIAGLLGKNAATVRSLLRQARATLLGAQEAVE